ncbi:unnamed protein product [Medioppia subpectinata]|uniref:RING-type domain-containing protein n=1 Tax=Medioppia subpectinata TaxID=1979941 RepID=A0A7R9KQZ9_9ACAR|nr:unnamed protein product [Medioppia subpectinata]CAG2107105.1 unnamed protein product [Medioppia subpectinata]
MPGFDSKRFIGLEDWLAKELECSICLHVYDRAVDTNCGHTFCRDCLQQTISNNRLVCPQCRHESVRKRQRSLTANECSVNINESLFKANRRVDSIIGRLRTSCDFEDKGCDEVLELGSLSAHLEKCNYNLCENCGLKVGKRLDHNCLELMKNERKRFMNSIIGYKFKLNQTNKRLKCLETKNKELEEEIKLLKGSAPAVTTAAAAAQPKTTSVTVGAVAHKTRNYGIKTPKRVRTVTKTINIYNELGKKRDSYRMTNKQTFDDLVKSVAKTFDTDPQPLSITFNGSQAIARTDTITKLNIPSNKRSVKAYYQSDQNIVNINL